MVEAGINLMKERLEDRGCMPEQAWELQQAEAD
jgi:hypothetical protein